MLLEELLPRPGIPTVITWTVPWVREAQLRGRDSDYIVMWLDVAKVDASWRKEPQMHIGPGGTGLGPIGDRYQRFDEWVRQGYPVEMPEGCFQQGGGYDDVPVWYGPFGFTNGRHRFSWMRDHGVTAVPFIVPRYQRAKISKELGTKERESRVTKGIE